MADEAAPDLAESPDLCALPDLVEAPDLTALPDLATVGSLARALCEAQVELRAVEQYVDHFLESLFPGWRARFPTSVGWRFTAPSALDVYGVPLPSPAAVNALRRAGFLDVTLHPHSAMTLACACPPEPSVHQEHP